ncbi:MAG: tyrosine-type recombinase/integrase [Candidatus Woesearchaeota archaeon]
MKANLQHAEKFKKWYLRQGHTYASAQEYYNNIKRFIGKSGEKEINQKTVDRFRAKAMRTTTSGALKKFFYYLVRHHGFPEEILNIRFDRNKQTKKYPESITAQEVQIIINKMPTLKYKVLTLFIFELGLRLSEALKIKWEDFNWADWIQDRDSYGKVALKNTKRNKFRTLPVKPELMNLLYDICPKKSSEGIPLGHVVFDFGIEDYILNKERPPEENIYLYLHKSSCRYREYIYDISKKYLNKRISPHRLRHSKAQMLLDKGMPLDSLKQFLGHEKISSTEIYAQASSEKVKRDLEAYDTFKKSQTENLVGK